MNDKLYNKLLKIYNISLRGVASEKEAVKQRLEETTNLTCKKCGKPIDGVYYDNGTCTMHGRCYKLRMEEEKMSTYEDLENRISKIKGWTEC